LAEKRVQ
jgi:hypothetical protein